MDDENGYYRDQWGIEYRESVEIELRSTFEVDPEINAIDYLDRGVRFLLETPTNSLSWKWVVIAMHGALYGFCLAALRGSNPDLVRSENNPKFIIDFGTALDWCKCIDRLKKAGYAEETPLTLTPEQEESIIKIHKGFRNLFEHFPAEYWEFSNLDIAEHVGAYFEVIEKIVVELQACHPALDEHQMERIKALCISGKSVLNSLLKKLNFDKNRGDELGDMSP